MIMWAIPIRRSRLWSGGDDEAAAVEGAVVAVRTWVGCDSVP